LILAYSLAVDDILINGRFAAEIDALIDTLQKDDIPRKVILVLTSAKRAGK
jgi:hypothetical protein